MEHYFLERIVLLESFLRFHGRQSHPEQGCHERSRAETRHQNPCFPQGRLLQSNQYVISDRLQLLHAEAI